MKTIVTTIFIAFGVLTLTAQDSKTSEEQANSIAEFLCNCLDKVQNTDDVTKCSSELKSKYPDYNKEDVPQELRDELKFKIEKCMETNYKRINANVPIEVREKNNKMGAEIVVKLCDCYDKVEESKGLRECSTSIMAEYKDFEKDKMDFEKRNELESSMNNCIKENFKRLESK